MGLTDKDREMLNNILTNLNNFCDQLLKSDDMKMSRPVHAILTQCRVLIESFLEE